MRSKSNTKQIQASFDPEHQNGILGFMAFSRSHGYGVLAVAIFKFESSCYLARMNCLVGKMGNALYWFGEIPNCI